MVRGIERGGGGGREEGDGIADGGEGLVEVRCGIRRWGVRLRLEDRGLAGVG